MTTSRWNQINKYLACVETEGICLLINIKHLRFWGALYFSKLHDNKGYCYFGLIYIMSKKC